LHRRRPDFPRRKFSCRMRLARPDLTGLIDLTIMVTLGESMKTATVSKLKASLSEYLREVKAGEEVLVTERGRAIAKLTPAGSSATLPQHLAEMEKQGLIKVGSAKLPKDFWNLPRPKDSKGLVLKSLLQEREEGR
jgi:prevent-host-death family protein